jgi:hypothetical protein
MPLSEITAKDTEICENQRDLRGKKLRTYTEITE